MEPCISTPSILSLLLPAGINPHHNNNGMPVAAIIIIIIIVVIVVVLGGLVLAVLAVYIVKCRGKGRKMSLRGTCPTLISKGQGEKKD